MQITLICPLGAPRALSGSRAVRQPLQGGAGGLQLKQRNVAVGTSVDVYYSEKTSSENRGSVTDFSAGMTPTKSTDHWSTKNFGGTSIFEQVSHTERFDRCPLLSAETIREVTKAISVNTVVR